MIITEATGVVQVGEVVTVLVVEATKTETVVSVLVVEATKTATVVTIVTNSNSNK